MSVTPDPGVYPEDGVLTRTGRRVWTLETDEVLVEGHGRPARDALRHYLGGAEHGLDDDSADRVALAARPDWVVFEAPQPEDEVSWWACSVPEGRPGALPVTWADPW